MAEGKGESEKRSDPNAHENQTLDGKNTPHDQRQTEMQRDAVETAALSLTSGEQLTHSDQSTFIDLPARDATDSFPIQDWDRYQFESLLGEGGMGRVYKAFDPNLERHAALKFIRGDDPEMMQRFVYEAQNQAKVEHENVCKIYEVGQVQGRLYIAMQYLEGGSLKDAYRQMPLDQKIRVMKQVAEGIHAAHRLGLIHRDIKPANIMLQRTEDGSLKPYVMDFGLARQAQSQGMTMTGMIVGTPAYMSPEQAWGEAHKLDRRSDIYSLGATLYELLCGRPPFQADSTMELLRMVKDEEPAPLRELDPNIAGDLQTIAMKCLEKEQNRRYDSAKALAEDLQRYLDGEPVQAQRASLLYRISKRARKNKMMVAVCSAALLLVLIFAAISARSHWIARERTRIAQRFGQQVKEMETIMRFASYMQPLHDVRREKNMVKQRIETIQKEMGALGDIGSAAGNYAIGRGYFALEEYATARYHLEQAWKDGYQEPEVAYSLGLVLGQIYQVEMERLYLIPRNQREQRQKELDRDLKDPALSYLKQGVEIKTEAPEYARALIAFYQKQWKEALRDTDSAFQKIPWLYEAKRLKGSTLVAMGTEKRVRGDHEGARTDYTQALKAYQEAIEIARSDPDSYSELCNMWDQVTEILSEESSSPEESMTGAVQACQNAIQADPDAYLPYLKLSDAYWRLAEYQIARGQDANPMIDRAISTARQSLRIQPSAYAHDNIGIAFMLKASPGEDPRALLEESIDNFRQALKLNPDFSSSLANMGIAHAEMGKYQTRIGLDPRRSFQESVSLYTQHLKLDPDQAFIPYANLSSVYNDKALYEMMVGIDPSDTLNKSIQCAREAIEANPESIESYLNGAGAYTLMGESQLQMQTPPDEVIAKAEEWLAKAENINQESPDLSHIRERLALLRAIWNCQTNQDSTEDFAQARRHLQHAMNLSHNKVEYYQDLAEISLKQAEWMHSSKQTIASVIRQGLEAIANAAESNVLMDRTLALQGRLYVLQGKAGGNPAAKLKGQDILNRALAINKNLARDLRPYLEP